MPNVSRKRLLQSIRKEKNTVAGDRLRACLHRKDGCSIRRICKIMVRPYTAKEKFENKTQNFVTD